MNSSKPSESIPQTGGKIIVKTFTPGRWDIGCKDEKPLHGLIGFPDGTNIGSTEEYRGETHR